MNQRGIDDGALFEQQPFVGQMLIDHVEQCLSQFVFFKQVAEVEHGGFVRHPVEVDAGKAAN